MTYVKYSVEFTNDTITFTPLSNESGQGLVSLDAVRCSTKILKECIADFDAFTTKYGSNLIGLGERYRAREEASFWAIPLSNKGDFYLYFDTVETKPTRVCFAPTSHYLYE